MNAVNLSEIASHILAVLQLRHVGRDNAIKRADLLDIVWRRMGVNFLTDRTLRKAIEKCAPQVCACAKGYFIPADITEKQQAIAYQVKKLIGQRRRIDAIAAAFPELESYVQGRLAL